MTAGPRGASLNFSGRGTFANVGIAGTGLSSRTKLSGPSQARSSGPTGTESSFRIRGSVDDETGRLILVNENGQEVPPEHFEAARKQHKDALVGLLESVAEELNGRTESLALLHTKMPTGPVQFTPAPFLKQAPERPAPQAPPLPYPLIARLFKSVRAKTDAANAERAAAYAHLLQGWQKLHDHFESDAREHASRQARLRHEYEISIQSDPDAMTNILTQRLEQISWPRETNMSLEVRDGGALVLIDVDLPEIHDMPTEQRVVMKRELALARKALPETRVRELYMRHVHSLGLRIVGEVFATLPKSERVVVSGFSQRANRQTGSVEDQYLFSSRVARHHFERLNLAQLAAVDPVAAFEVFETRREMSKTGVFKPVEPYTG